MSMRRHSLPRDDSSENGEKKVAPLGVLDPECFSMSDDWFQLKNPASGLCVEVPEASQANHVATVFAPCQAGDHQLWKKVPKSDGWFALVAKHSDKGLLMIPKD